MSSEAGTNGSRHGDGVRVHASHCSLRALTASESPGTLEQLKIGMTFYLVFEMPLNKFGLYPFKDRQLNMAIELEVQQCIIFHGGHTTKYKLGSTLLGSMNWSQH